MSVIGLSPSVNIGHLDDFSGATTQFNLFAVYCDMDYFG